MTKRVRRRLPPITVGSVWKTENFGECEVLGYVSSRDITIKFYDTGSIVKTTGEVLRRGSSRDPFRPVIYGIGYQGVGVKTKLPDGTNSPIYSIWRQMLSRCYNPKNPKYHRYGLRGYVVTPEWHNFQNYYTWYMENQVSGYQVDKDLTSPHSKIYSPDTCSFIPKELNAMLTSNVARRGKHPVGVYEWKNKEDGHKKFTAHLSRKCEGLGRGETLGYFHTPEEAFACYKAAKEDQIKQIATERFRRGEISQQVYQTLMQWEVVPFPE